MPEFLLYDDRISAPATVGGQPVIIEHDTQPGNAEKPTWASPLQTRWFRVEDHDDSLPSRVGDFQGGFKKGVHKRVGPRWQIDTGVGIARRHWAVQPK